MGLRPRDHDSYEVEWYRVKEKRELILNPNDLLKKLTPLARVSDATDENTARAFIYCVERVYLEQVQRVRRHHPAMMAHWIGKLDEKVGNRPRED